MSKAYYANAGKKRWNSDLEHTSYKLPYNPSSHYYLRSSSVGSLVIDEERCCTPVNQSTSDNVLNVTPFGQKLKQLTQNAADAGMSTPQKIHSTAVLSFTADHALYRTPHKKALNSIGKGTIDDPFLWKEAISAGAIVEAMRRHDIEHASLMGSQKKLVYSYSVKNNYSDITTTFSGIIYKKGGMSFTIPSLGTYESISYELQLITSSVESQIKQKDQKKANKHSYIEEKELAYVLEKLSKHENVEKFDSYNKKTQEFLSHLTCLLFIGEVYRNSSASLTVHMFLDLVKSGGKHFADLVELFPMAMHKAVSAHRACDSILSVIKEHQAYNIKGPVKQINSPVVKKLLERNTKILESWGKLKTAGGKPVELEDYVQLISDSMEQWLGFEIKRPPIAFLDFSSISADSVVSLESDDSGIDAIGLV